MPYQNKTYNREENLSQIQVWYTIHKSIQQKVLSLQLEIILLPSLVMVSLSIVNKSETLTDATEWKLWTTQIYFCLLKIKFFGLQGLIGIIKFH